MTGSPKSLKISARQVIDHMKESVVITDASNKIISINPAFTAVTGYSKSDVLGKNPGLLKSGRHRESFYRKMWECIKSDGSWQGEITNRRKNGDIYTEWLTISKIKGSGKHSTCYMGVFTDISERKRAEEKIQHMAYFDPLTGLPNRNLFRDRLKAALTVAQRHKEILAVMFLDLDRVKVINDTLGHAVGDELLKAVAERLQNSLNEGETIARLGGDEFMLLFPDIGAVESLTQITKKIIDVLKPAFRIGRHDLYITASIGVSLYPQDGKDIETLSKNADTAMYRAKQQGRNNFQVFNPAMKDEVFEQLALGNSLRRALERGEFVVHYQPQISIATGEIIGMEALVRWQHPQLGLVPPSRFIHWAEESGLIVPLGEWVLRHACQQNHDWQKAGYPPLRVGVNLSARQFEQDNLVKTVVRALEDSGMAPECLDLELTESVVMESAGSLLTIPHDLQAIGVKFSIDDFGKGYSSLSYLKRFPVNTLKMDQSFVQEIATDPNDAAIATAVVALGHSLNLSVLAEGVETEEQLAILKSLKCDKMQGFLFSEPVGAIEFEEILKTKKFMESGSLFDHNWNRSS